MNLNTFLDLLDQYGPEPVKWPETERETMLEFLQTSPEAARQTALSKGIESDLARLEHTVTPGLKGRIVALAAAQEPSFFDPFLSWITASFWRPALLSVALLALSVLLGMALPSVPSENEASFDIAGLLLDEVYTHYE
ncbi:MAG: hypothetical protein FJ194_18005 [Gammaproteobacteria bacterium]|nr:hypothetical protein [Gammaproteobacteria bacterium]